MERVGAQVQAAMQMMDAQMAQMPPAQRAQMEAMMRGRGMPSMAAATKPEYRKGGTSKAGRWTCDVYEAYANGEKTGEVCTVGAAAIGFGAADFDIANQLAGFFAKMLPQAGAQIQGFGTADKQGYVGFPVKSVMTVNGQQVTSELLDATKQNFPDTLFTVPAGYAKRDLLGGMMGGMGGMGAGRGR